MVEVWVEEGWVQVAVELALSTHTHALRLHYVVKEPLQLATTPAFAVWHGTRLPYLRDILSTKRLVPGTAEPVGIYSFSEKEKQTT